MSNQKEKLALLRIKEILDSRKSPLAKEVENVFELSDLSNDLGERIIDELGDEFSSKGLCANSEPNSYGLEIEELTDLCNR